MSKPNDPVPAVKKSATDRVGEVLTLAGLPPEVTLALGKAGPPPGAFDDDTLGAMVAAKTLTEDQARALGFAAGLYGLVDEDLTLATAIRGAVYPRLGGKPATSTADLARLSSGDWGAFLSMSKVTLPVGSKPDSLSAALAGRFGALHPGVAITGRLPSVDVQQILTPTDPAAVTAVVVAYPGLKLQAVLDDSRLAPKDKAAAFTRRVGLVQQLSAALGDINVLRLDLGSLGADLGKLGLDKLGATDDEKPMVLAVFQTYQRAWTLTKNVDDAHALVAKGYVSSLAIAKQGLDDFRTQTGFDPSRAHRIQNAALDTIAQVNTAVAAIGDLTGGVQVGPRNQLPSAASYLKKLAGYDALFGNLSFCDCEECRSILGPAAYFVDLMKYITDHLLTQFVASPPNPIDLEVRRPDLWTLELSCDNTNLRVPTLDLVNEILENYVGRRLNSSLSLDDRAAVDALVYQHTLYDAVTVANAASFRQPFHLPLVRIASYLPALGHTRAEVAVAVAGAAGSVAAELGLAPTELALITTANADLGRLGHLYNVRLAAQADGSVATTTGPLDATALAAAIGVTRAELLALVAAAFVKVGAPLAHIGIPQSDANGVTTEHVTGVTADGLDRLHRLLRLAHKTGWSVAELDLVLTTLGDTTLASVVAIAGVHALQMRVGVTVPEVCALVGPLPSTLLDRLFNPAPFHTPDRLLPKPAARFLHPAFRQTTTPSPDPDQMLPRLLGGLGLTLGSLEDLIRGLAPHLSQEANPADRVDPATTSGFDPHAASELARYFVLSSQNLTLLHRHARTAQLLGLSIPELFRLLQLLDLSALSGLEAIVAVLDLQSWRRASGYSLDDVFVATGRTPAQPSAYSDPAVVAAAVQLAASTALTFTDTVFALALGHTESQSRALLTLNPTIVEPIVGPASTGRWRIRLGVDLTTAPITLPAVPVLDADAQLATTTEIRDALAPYVPSGVLARSLAAACHVDTDKVVALAALTSQSLTTDAVLLPLRGEGHLADLAALIAAISPSLVAFAAPVWDATAIDFVRLHHAAFDLPPVPRLPPLNLKQLRALSVYARLGAAANDPAAAARQEDLRAVLSAYTDAGFPPPVESAIANVLDVSAGLIAGLRGRVTLPAVAAYALDQLAQATQLATSLGVDGQTLVALVSDGDYRPLSSAADALLSALGARYSDDATRAAKLDAAERLVREARRDALADYLIHSVRDPANQAIWSSLDELYDYFLIDVETSGCTTISRVVAATMTAQLYVYRAIMNLEQDRAGDFVLSLDADAAKQWPWRKNFRVWQANRKVFLWPENYLDPDLRDDKTPLFKDLEQELLQTDLNDQNVLDAYTKYLAGLEEVGSLTVAGAYHERRGATDVFHLFGVTAGDPPTYYWRSCENLIEAHRPDGSSAESWSAWQKINVQITGRKVSPVVHLGRLHVFWIDIHTQPVNQIANGASTFDGYRHTLSLKVTSLRPDYTWTAPQEIELPDVHPPDPNFGPGRGQVLDPLIPIPVPPSGWIDQMQIDAEVAVTRAEAAVHAAEAALAWAAFSGGFHVPEATAALGIAARVLHDANDALTEANRTHQERVDAHATHPENRVKLDLTRRPQSEANDNYTLSGPSWDWAWLQSQADPPKLTIQLRDFRAYAEIDLFRRTATTIAPIPVQDTVTPFLCAMGHTANITSGRLADPASLYRATPRTLPVWPNPAFANAVLDTERVRTYRLEDPSFDPLLQVSTSDPLATMAAGVDFVALAVPGSEQDVLVQIGDDILLLQGSVTDDSGYTLRRLGTTVVGDLGRCLFEDKLDALLSTDSQLHRFQEAINLPISVQQGIDTSAVVAGKLDFAGPYGIYYRELFVHIPFLIANALNSRGRFEAAQRWYHYIFDPTAAVEEFDLTGVAPGDVAHRLLDRVWRYSQFRGQGLEHLHAVLTDTDALERYKQDPFNPWAIVRTRVSGFQKAIVMKYVDNVLDWADSLFAQFTTESVNEALMLYNLARDVLGPEPTQLGDCPSGVEPNTYQTIAPLLDGNDDFLIEIESVIVGAQSSSRQAPRAARYRPIESAIARAVNAYPLVNRAPDPRGIFVGPGTNETPTLSWGPALGNATIKTIDPVGGRSFHHAAKADFGAQFGRFGWSIVRQMSPAFCIPANADLLAYWDRVADRLYKIRHCLDIDGNPHELALFAPPIDPMQLVAMKAAGLSLDDVLGGGNGSLPPYRFLYLIERAKSFAAALAGFGSALLSSLEKKDSEQLNRVRLTQQLNLTQLTTQIRQLEIDAATQSREAIDRQRQAAVYRSDFYAGLISQNRNGWEIAESIARHTAGSIHVTESIIQFVGAIVALVPNAGAPTAMTYGGSQLNQGMKGFGYALDALAKGAESIAASASLEAGFARRLEGWANQKALADYDVQSLDRQLQAANIRLDIANRSVTLHDKSLEQLQEFLDLTDGKFTSIGLYTWMSGQLQTLYRTAYQNALALAKLAEEAYRFERSDDRTAGLRPSYWDATHAGLLAGEGLLMGLQSLERRFLETNYRTPEVDQAFALSQVNPQALVNLHEVGECTFDVSEVFFDLFYPGHYKRRIKAVRLTIPCITGPYVNVSATLALTASQIRPTPVATALVDVPPSRSVSIATSTAQNDAGVFELSFRDERYMPFEGLGAISSWRLTLPRSFRQFDYQTINDVILSISYTAEDDGVLRGQVESNNAALEGSILAYFSTHSAQRLFSLRQDFSNAFTRLLRSPVSTPGATAGVTFELSDRSFPSFFRGRALHVVPGSAQLLLRTATGTTASGFEMTVDGGAVTAFAPSALGNLLGASVPSEFFTGDGIRFGPHTLAITAPGNLAPPSSPAGDPSAIDASKLLDVLLYLEYKLI